MYKYHELRALHIEVSSLCQAKCPMCARNHHGGLVNPNLIEKNMDLSFYKNAVTPEFIKQIGSISMCGNFGDPILNKNLIPILEYTKKENKYINIQIHTNGSARSVSWWKNLAEALPENHLVLFGIDGFEDTHSLYRIGTDYNTIIRNAKAFIKAGGKARWNFITFKHNEHQLEKAREYARELGFESFQEKQTSRFIGTKQFDVYDNNGDTVYTLLPPSTKKIAFIDRKTVENYKEVIKASTITCQVEQQKSVYIDALGHLWPCCFLGSVPYQYSTPNKLVFDFMNESTASLNKTIELMGGMQQLDLRHNSIESIVDSEQWQTVWNQGFENKSILMCARVCGKVPNVEISQCRDQFLDLEEFDE